MPRPGGTAYGSRVIELGVADGLDVWELQIKLIGWGSGSDNDGIGLFMDPVKVHGKYDTTTRDAVMRFQKAHGLGTTGVVEGDTFRALDDELTQHPVLLADLRCPCVAGKNDGPILCRCPDHPNAGKCAGFGNKRFAGKYLLDNTPAYAAEKLAVYDMEEHDGIDKTVIWAVRALMHRAKVGRVKVVSGYRCWHDNYHHHDEPRWRHRRETFHFGKAISLLHPGTCVEKGNSACPECERMRGVALAKCGYQLRWHELDRVVVGEGRMDAAPPFTPFALHVDTVMLQSREKADFVKSDQDAGAPLYTGQVGLSLPVDLGEGRNPKVADTLAFHDNSERAKGGQFPLGTGRIWHSGVHLYPGKSGTVHAMIDGTLVACRVGEKDDAKPFGSRNFALLAHTFHGKALFSLHLHLDDGPASATSKTRWRRALYLLSVPHVLAVAPSPIYTRDKKGKLNPGPGLAPNERAETEGAELDPHGLDASIPAGSKVVKLKTPKNAYVYTVNAGSQTATLHAADAALADKIKKGEVIGLEKGPRVNAGESLGRVGKAPRDPGLSSLGPYLHLEVFSETNLLTDPGYVLVDAGAVAKVADRKSITEALVAAKLLTNPPDGVLLDADKTFGFMKDAERDALGDAFNEYRFWQDAKAGAKGAMPGGTMLFHYNPIALLLAMAYAP
jgi:hypothetical protein